jgi:putative transposase
MTRQNYYKQRSLRQRQTIDEELVLELVRRERWRQPRLGGRKLRHVIGPELQAAGVSIGRDRFFKLLENSSLLVPRKRRRARTTNSHHGFGVYPNLAKELAVIAPHQLLVSDITYLRTSEGFMYLALVMDAFSRAIVGYDCSNSLEVVGALRALKMAIRQLPVEARAMHHSDRGIQYCCREYIQRLERGRLSISMTEQNHCYENSQAERLNGTLKHELGLNETFSQPADARRAVGEAVMIYNHYRPHQALGYRMPLEIHGGSVRRPIRAA